MKRVAGDNCKSTLNIEFEQDWSFTLDATLGDREKIKQEDPLRSYSLVSAIVFLFVLFVSIQVLKLVENELLTSIIWKNKNNIKRIFMYHSGLYNKLYQRKFPYK